MRLYCLRKGLGRGRPDARHRRAKVAYFVRIPTIVVEGLNVLLTGLTVFGQRNMPVASYVDEAVEREVFRCLLLVAVMVRVHTVAAAEVRQLDLQHGHSRRTSKRPGWGRL